MSRSTTEAKSVKVETAGESAALDSTRPSAKARDAS